MTTPETETPQPPKPPAQYQISFERLAQLNRSPLTLVADRRPAACPSLQKPDQGVNRCQKVSERNRQIQQG